MGIHTNYLLEILNGRNYWGELETKILERM